MKATKEWNDSIGYDFDLSNNLVEAIQTDAREPLLTTLKEDLECFEVVQKYFIIRAFRNPGEDKLLKSITDAIARIKEVISQ